MIRSLLFRGLPALAVLLACAEGGGPGGTSTLSIKLTDAPGDIRHAFVTITEVYLMGEGGKLVLRDTPFTADLLTLAGTTTDLVSDAEVPSGRYSQLRFVVGGACLAVENETGGADIHATPEYDSDPCGGPAPGELETPGFDRSGLKVVLHGGALELDGGRTVLLVDFDVAQSFGHPAGGSGRWVMHPVVTGGEIETGE